MNHQLTIRKRLPAGWRTVRTSTGTEYHRIADGARVYQYSRRAWQAPMWGAWVPAWGCGTPIGTSRAYTIEYVDRHYPIGPTEDQWLAALGPCGK